MNLKDKRLSRYQSVTKGKSKDYLKVGDRVVLVDIKRQGYELFRDGCNPLIATEYACSGVVESGDAEYCRVNWDNGTFNTYGEGCLLKLSDFIKLTGHYKFLLRRNLNEQI